MADPLDSSPTSLDDLPLEICSHICGFLENVDAKNVRLCSKSMAHASTSHLFSHLKCCMQMQETRPSLPRIEAILANGEFRKYARSLDFEVSDDDPMLADALHDAMYREDDSHAERGQAILRSFGLSLAKISDFPNLRSVALDLPSWSSMDSLVTVLTGWPRVNTLFTALATLAGVGRPVRNLTLEHTPIVMPVLPHQRKSDHDISSFLEHLYEFHVNVSIRPRGCKEISSQTVSMMGLDVEGSEQEAAWIAQPILWSLNRVMLPRMSSNLTALTMYYGHYSGYEHKSSLYQIFFPRLRRLHLGNLVFGVDAQFEWIFSHSATLQSLRMDDCPIVYFIETPYEFDSDGYINDAIPINWTDFNNKRFATRDYPRTWAKTLDEFRERIHNLKDFYMGAADWQHVDVFKQLPELKPHLKPSRYRKRYGQLVSLEGSNKGVERDVASTEHAGLLKKHNGADHAALLRLLYHTGQLPRPKSGSTDTHDLFKDEDWPGIDLPPRPSIIQNEIADNDDEDNNDEANDDADHESNSELEDSDEVDSEFGLDMESEDELFFTPEDGAGMTPVGQQVADQDA